MSAGQQLRASSLPVVDRLAGHGDSVALITDSSVITYRDLALRVDDVRRSLGEGTRRLVLVGIANRLEGVVAYLGALAAGHVVLLVDGDDPGLIASLTGRYDPDAVVRPVEPGAERWEVVQRRAGTVHDLHPELALLLGTSGSTGSPKLVRLSASSVQANAESIASYLELGPGERAVTTLPLHYSYGLSVLHSHLVAGAAVLVTDLSVVDRCFWDFCRAHGATSFAGVPYTFELLDRIGFGEMALPSLRYVTQAGGRLDPERVRGYAEMGRDRGWKLFVMYGQTEATARMAYLPPDLAAEHPDAIGVPIPGGSFRLDPEPGASPDAGELVYRGPNVMLGYAEGPDDLREGRTVDELRTGDIGRLGADGLLRITGRRNRFIKITGLRVDLGQVEVNLARAGIRAACAGRDEVLTVAVETDDEASDVRRAVLETLGLPPRSVRVVAVPALPRLPNGKPDALAVMALADEGPPERPASSEPAAPPGVESVRTLYANLLEREVRDGDSFASLGGDSLSYVQVSLGLEELLRRLPDRWPSMTVGELGRLAQAQSEGVSPRPRLRLPRALSVRRIETTVGLRALAILAIVGTHSGLFELLGGAHILLAVAGYNFARFQLTDAPRLTRLRSQGVAVARVALPAVAWIAFAFLVLGAYAPHNLLLLNTIVGPRPFTPEWHFWFIELLVYILVAMAALLAIPAVDRTERRWPQLVPWAVLGLGLAFRFGLLEFGILQTRPVLWLFALGWAASQARTGWQRLAVLGVAGLAVPDFFGNTQRDAMILAGVGLLVLVRSVPVPALLAPLAGVLASSSLYVYLVHWQVYPKLMTTSPALAVGASVAAGIVLWMISGKAMSFARLLPRLIRRRRDAAVVAWRPSDLAGAATTANRLGRG